MRINRIKCVQLICHGPSGKTSKYPKNARDYVENVEVMLTVSTYLSNLIFTTCLIL